MGGIGEESARMEGIGPQHDYGAKNPHLQNRRAHGSILRLAN